MSRKDPRRVLVLSLTARQMACLRAAAWRGGLGNAARRLIEAGLASDLSVVSPDGATWCLVLQLPRAARVQLQTRAHRDMCSPSALASGLIPLD